MFRHRLSIQAVQKWLKNRILWSTRINLLLIWLMFTHCCLSNRYYLIQASTWSWILYIFSKPDRRNTWLIVSNSTVKSGNTRTPQNSLCYFCRAVFVEWFAQYADCTTSIHSLLIKCFWSYFKTTFSKETLKKIRICVLFTHGQLPQNC